MKLRMGFEGAKLRRGWYAATAVIVAVYATVSWMAYRGRIHPGYGLNFFGDSIQFALLGIAAAVICRRIFQARGRERTFWIFLSFGAALWLLAESEWVWYELVRKTDVPDPSMGDVLLFVHTIPVMGALLLGAHRANHPRRREIDTLDFLLLLFWSVFLYAFIIMPWQFGGAAVQNISLAGKYYSILYFIENGLMVLMAALVWMRAAGSWRKIYANLLLAGLCYALCSVLLNRAILLGGYYTGSLYDVPLVASICFFCSVGLVETGAASATPRDPLPAQPREWPAALATLSLVAMPALALAMSFFSGAPPAVNDFRLKATLAVILALTFFVFLKQRLLNLEMRQVLQDSQQSFLNLQRMQDHLVNSEKMAALGQLVAGAAHEINNPLTAILGYAELLGSDQSVPEQPRSLAEKIGFQARRTKRLVANMLSFAQQQPASKSAVHINTLLNNVLQLREPDLAGKKIRVVTNFDVDLPHVWGDSNHLLQVFLHIVNNAVDALLEVGGGVINITTSAANGMAAVEIADTGPGIKDANRIFDPFFTTKPIGKGTGLGLSVCYGIVKDHQGDISCHNNASGGASFVIKIPAMTASEEQALASVETGAPSGS